jgi:hypothetical protein
MRDSWIEIGEVIRQPIIAEDRKAQSLLPPFIKGSLALRGIWQRGAGGNYGRIRLVNVEKMNKEGERG